MQQIGSSSGPTLMPATPSRWAYRMQRLMLTPLFRLVLRFVIPFVVVFAVVSAWFADQDRRDQVVLWIAEVRDSIQTRPEFMVNVMAIDGASLEIDEDIREIVQIDFPVSSFDLSLEEIREQVAGLSPVADVTVRIRPGGILQVTVSERLPVAVWRTGQGLELLDMEGRFVAPAETRADHSALPLIVGDGAEGYVAEALALTRAAGPLGPRLRGLVRVGARRWDVVLTRDQRILLPEQGAVQALERVIALNQAQDMLGRDLMSVDMRIAERPTIRLSQKAVEEWWQIRQTTIEAGAD